jgi:dTDP-4-dehydrorhamnose reductase
MKFLVTGANGQLGKEWVHFLKDGNYPFSQYRSGDLDITDQEAVIKVLKKERPDVVLNCAAYTKVDEAENNPEKAFLVNKTGVQNLLMAAEQMNLMLVHYSTDYVFPGKAVDEKNYPAGYTEDASTDPVNVYGSSKRAGEKLLEKSSANWLLIRVSWLCGQFGSNFVTKILQLAKERDQLKVVNDQMGSPSFTFDVVSKSFQLITEECRGKFHVSSGGKISWAEFAKEILHQIKSETVVYEVPSSEFPVIAKRPSFSLLSKEKLITYGLNPVDWKDGLSKLLHQIKNR